MQFSSDKNLIMILLVGLVIVVGMLVIQPKATEIELNSLVKSNNVDPSILPSLHSVSKQVHLNSLEEGGSSDELIYGDTTLTLINGYPSAEDIASVAGLADGSYQLDQQTGESLMINNGDCLIVYTEAKVGMAPEIIDLFNSCK